MKTRIEYEAERQAILDDAQKILNAASDAGTLTVEADAEVSRLMEKADGVWRLMAKATDDRLADNPDIRRMLNQGGGAPYLPHDGRNSFPGLSNGPVFQDAAGNKIQAKAGNEKFSAQQSDGAVGQIIHNLLRGDLVNSANFGSTDSAGGYLISPQMSGMVLDLARSASVCMRAGAITIPMSTSELTIARVSGDATPMWRAETVAVQSSALTFNKVTLRAKTLAAIVPVSDRKSVV